MLHNVIDRAIQAYKFFYPTVSGAAIVRGNEQTGMVPNRVFGILDCGPEQLVFTAADLPARLAEHGDLMAPLLEPGPELPD